MTLYIDITIPKCLLTLIYSNLRSIYIESSTLIVLFIHSENYTESIYSYRVNYMSQYIIYIYSQIDDGVRIFHFMIIKKFKR